MTQIRYATETDLVQVSRIFRDAINTASWLPVPARANSDFGEASSGEEVFVYFNETNGVLGFISVQSAESYIHHLFVDRAFQGQGIGTALLGSLEDWLPLPWRLKCVDANKNAMRFYVSHGWKEIGTGNSDHGKYSLLEFAGR